MNEQSLETIGKRRDKNKEAMVEQLKKTPIIQIACEKAGISRATYYRWRKDDKEFDEQAEESLLSGIALINDMAESQLISAIKDKKLTAIIFWLKNRHQNYTNRIEITNADLRTDNLTPEQESVIKQALEFATFSPNDKLKQNNVNLTPSNQ